MRPVQYTSAKTAHTAFVFKSVRRKVRSTEPPKPSAANTVLTLGRIINAHMKAKV